MKTAIIILIFGCSLISNAQEVSNPQHDFGKVIDWNNPIYTTTYTNTSDSTQLFLPIGQDKNIRVIYGKNSLAPGESTTISIQYFTDIYGRFRKEVRLFVSTQNEPILLSMKGNIKSFHPDANTVCPRIENEGTRATSGFVHTIKVVDKETNEILTDYDLDIVTPNSEESIEVSGSALKLKRSRPQFYNFTVDKEGYEIAKAELYVQRNTKETTFYLKRERVDEDPAYFDFNADTIVSQPVKDTLVSTFEDVLSEEPALDTGMANVLVSAPKISTIDFSKDGTLNKEKYSFNNIIFLIDVSSSMKSEDKLPVLKRSIKQMISILRPEDQVSIITYSTKTTLVADHISGANKEKLYASVDTMVAKGSSHGSEAVNIAYEQAKKYYIKRGNNEIILASDGVLNSKGFNEKRLYRKALIQYAANGVRMSTIGFGRTTRALRFLETLATKGQGDFIEIKNLEEADSKLIQNMMSHSLK